MKFLVDAQLPAKLARALVDAQLPAKLARALVDAGHDALHTSDLPDGNRTTDGEIARRADVEGRVVVTKDADFLELRTGDIVVHQRRDEAGE